MQDKGSEKRFIIALFLSIFFHLLVLLLVYALSKLTHTPPRLEKIDASNLLVLKRGHSQDPSKNKPGAPPVTKANKSNPTPIQSINTPPTMPTLDATPSKNNPAQAQKTPPKQEEKSKITQQKKQQDSKEKALHKYDKDYIDPKNLSLLSKQQMMALQIPQNSSQSLQDDKGLDSDTKEEIDELYGDEFGDLGSAEKDFIKNNLRDIGRITQKYLQYPREAGYLGQDGENAIEFYLYPNGDISDLKIIKNSGSIILDKNTTRTIEIAYKDYPRPTTKTLIRIKVRYFLYR
ncbi:TonB family protein [Helicobacter cappadocius]|uniref:TonB family protein n=1 Tax=Helicobacter cappadocius TaxID=3063998 RepID=A0AA90SS29_9HELI|nr:MULTISPECIES: TonB family protein [unclassified Helicobacter]MDO7252607.1 TonB family protein [Helicobacter sp. faydin-H75]MDP2538474.1 TonB family protein [Helicobacter sp. faydin-H76]